MWEKLLLVSAPAALPTGPELQLPRCPAWSVSQQLVLERFLHPSGGALVRAPPSNKAPPSELLLLDLLYTFRENTGQSAVDGFKATCLLISGACLRHTPVFTYSANTQCHVC